MNYSHLDFRSVLTKADGATSPSTVMTTHTPARAAGGIAQVDDALEDVQLTVYDEGIKTLAESVPPSSLKSRMSQVFTHEWRHAMAHTSTDQKYAAMVPGPIGMDVADLARLPPVDKIANADNFSYAVWLLRLSETCPASYKDFVSRYDVWLRSRSGRLMWNFVS